MDGLGGSGNALLILGLILELLGQAGNCIGEQESLWCRNSCSGMRIMGHGEYFKHEVNGRLEWA